jgi:uncharacterized repeat protein (TIGR03803 family)
MRKVELAKIACIAAIFCVATAVASPAQTFTTLVQFAGTPQPAIPGQLLQGMDGNLYGISSQGGTNGVSFVGGTIFRMTPAGKVNVLYSFCALANCADGTIPNGLIQAPSGKFYGTTGRGGAVDFADCAGFNTPGCGTFFEIAPGQALTTLYNFCSQTNCNDGFGPTGAPLAMGRNGNFYGTTEDGGDLNGDNNCEFGCGTIYEVTPTGTLTTLHVFCSTEGCPEGSEGDGLRLYADGNFYGATLSSASGDFGGGMYKITPGGNLTVLYTFDEEGNGDCCATAPIQATDGNLYGVGGGGGKFGEGFVYKLTPQGTLSSLYDFCALPNCADGVEPNQLIQGTDGNFYGTTTTGGLTNADCSAVGCGTLFQVTPAGKMTTVHSFCSAANCADGFAPQAGLVQGTNGIFYGPTFGGTDGFGTIFSLSMGLSPFVEANPNFGSAGKSVVIFGNNLTGTTSVTFNGVAAAFKVKSGTSIRAQVPAGATSGMIEVTTGSDVFSSNVAFSVVP